MTKIFLTILACFTSILGLSARADFLSVMAELKSMKTHDRSRLDRARECLPDLKDGRIRLCTGVEINLKKFLSFDFDSCVNEIQHKGYVVTYDNKKAEIPVEDFDSFVNSTKRAETFHNVKAVAFRVNVANRIDCLHELIHVYQWSSDSKNDLAPPNRAARTEMFQRKLEEGVAEIEKSERAKKTEEAQSRANMLKPYLDHLKEWNALTDWLDEKDAHYVIFSKCSELNCSLTDLDVATANLEKRRRYLPKSFYPKLDQTAKDVLGRLKNLKPSN